MRIFISHSSKNESETHELANNLEESDYVVWFDKELRKRGGQPWWGNILAEIRECDVFIYALAKQWLESAACQAEYHYAQALNKNILPVKVGEISNNSLPAEFSTLQIVDYRKPGDKRANELNASLKNLPLPLPLPDPLPSEPPVPLHLEEQEVLMSEDDPPQEASVFSLDEEDIRQALHGLRPREISRNSYFDDNSCVEFEVYFDRGWVDEYQSPTHFARAIEGRFRKRMPFQPQYHATAEIDDDDAIGLRIILRLCN